MEKIENKMEKIIEKKIKKRNWKKNETTIYKNKMKWKIIERKIKTKQKINKQLKRK